MSGGYSAMVSGATVGNLGDPGPSLQGDSCRSPGPRELTVVDSAVKLLWTNLSIISVNPETCACKGSRLAFIFSFTNSGESLKLLS